MTISTTTNTINRLSREKANIQHKLSLESRKEADINSRIAQVNRSVTKTRLIQCLKVSMLIFVVKKLR